MLLKDMLLSPDQLKITRKLLANGMMMYHAWYQYCLERPPLFAVGISAGAATASLKKQLRAILSKEAHKQR